MERENIKNLCKLIISNTYNSLVPGGVGYRTESYSGSNTHDPISILMYESQQLGNWWIILEAAQAVGVTTNTDVDDPWFVKGGWRELLDHINSHLRPEFPEPYALWLASRREVIKHYNAGHKQGIDKYNIPQNAIVLAGAGEPDGTLFVASKQDWINANL